MQSGGSKDVMEIVEGGCRGTTESRMGKLCQLQNNCVLKFYQVRLPLVTQNKKILLKDTIRRAQPTLVSGSLRRLLLLLVATKFMQSSVKDDKITKMQNWQLVTMFFFNLTTKTPQFYRFRQQITTFMKNSPI